MTEVETLQSLILEWAKEHVPNSYQQTLACSLQPKKFRNCLIRLIEIRAGQDIHWRNSLPLSVLDETSLCITVRVRSSGREVVVGGSKCPQRRISFKTLGVALTKQGFDAILDSVDTFDLQAVD